MKAFEIHTYQDGKWKIDSIFDDRELALFEARRVDEGSRCSGVRVVEENYDEANDLTTTRTIFRGGTAERQERTMTLSSPAKNRPSARRGAGAREPVKSRRANPSRNPSNFLVPVLILGGLLLVGLVALLGLQEMSQIR